MIIVLHPQPLWCSRWLGDRQLRAVFAGVVPLLSVNVRAADEPVAASLTPWEQWCSEYSNMTWMFCLADHLCFEYVHRFDQDPPVMDEISRCRRRRVHQRGLQGITAWPQVVPRAFRRSVANEPFTEDHPSIVAYREWYRTKRCEWTRREKPPWWSAEEPTQAAEIFAAEEEW